MSQTRADAGTLGTKEQPSQANATTTDTDRGKVVVSGWVEDEDGTPIEMATLQLNIGEVFGPISGPTSLIQAETDPTGRFEVRYRRPKQEPVPNVPASGFREGLGFVRHDSHVYTFITYTSPALDMHIKMAREGALVLGQVLEEDDTPVAGASVRPCLVWTETPALFLITIPRGATTDANGRFACDRLPPGRYSFAVSHEGDGFNAHVLGLSPDAPFVELKEKETTSGVILKPYRWSEPASTNTRAK